MPTSSDGTCQHCQDFLDEPPRPFSRDDIPLDWHTFPALQSCSQQCKLCSFMLRIIQQELDPKRLATLQEHSSVLQIYKNPAGRGNILLLIPKKGTGGGLKHSQLDSVVHGIVGKNIPSASHEAITNHTGSDETISRIQSWLKACEEHTLCKQWLEKCSESPSFLPTRLLQVNKDIRLVDATEVHDPRYAALSYCWGPRTGIRLLRSEIQSLRQSISYEELPATFRDAIDLVRRLGLSYIWIDALCIVQDNEQDWIVESPLMDQIYLHAHICIAATASDRSSGGLYRSRDPSLVRSVGSTQTIFMNRQHWEVRRSALSARSWIIQERFMATRTIHFGESQVFWECHQGCTSESFAPGSLILDLHFADRQEDAHKTWHQLAHDYTKGNLTYSTDRPVAISALSRFFSRILNCNYLYGIWEPRLKQDLPWRVTHDGSPKRRSTNVPTWSWLSINNASLTWQDTEPAFSIISAGTQLRLRARLCQVWLVFATKSTPNEMNKKPYRIMFQAETALAELHHAGQFFVDDYDSLVWLHESSARGRSCYIMHAGTGSTDIGIVLRNEGLGMFTRLGQMTWDWKSMESEYRRSGLPPLHVGDVLTGQAVSAKDAQCNVLTSLSYQRHLRTSIIPNSVCNMADQEHYYTFTLA